MRCRICGEQWDLDTLHDEVLVRNPDKPWMDAKQNSEARYQHSDGLWHNQKKYEVYFKKVVADFQTHGCSAIEGAEHSPNRISNNDSAIIGVAYQLMGDDVDGAISMMEDAESMGLFD